MTTRTRRVLQLAVISRVVVWCIAFVARQFTAGRLPPYDTSSLLLAATDEGDSCRGSGLDALLRSSLDGFDVWDGVHFIQPAISGYEHEKQYAFFPLLPAIIRFGAEYIVQPLFTVFGFSVCRLTVYKLVAFGVSNLAFVLAAAMLYQLSLRVFAADLKPAPPPPRNAGVSRSLFAYPVSHVPARVISPAVAPLTFDAMESISFRAAVLFCFGPASIFMSAAYTESLFALITFTALWLIERPVPPPPHHAPRAPPFRWAPFACAAILLGLSGLTRSNGTIYAGYFLYDIVAACMAVIAWPGGGSIRALLFRVIWALGCTFVAVAPFFGWQYAVADRICGAAREPLPSFCTGPVLDRVPYNYIQSKYWGVGLFKYYTLQQAPNFLLSAPVLAVSIAGVAAYVAADWRRSWTIGGLLGDNRQPPNTAATAPADTTAPTRNVYLSSSRAFVYVAHWSVLLLVCFTILHVQVSTRFLSATPPLYWYIASLAPSAHAPAAAGTNRKLFSAICVWFVAYGCIGTILFTRFYPWT